MFDKKNDKSSIFKSFEMPFFVNKRSGKRNVGPKNFF